MMKLPPSDEARIFWLVEAGWRRDQAERFVRNTPHTHMPIETRDEE
jgi:hypothetical protein